LLKTGADRTVLVQQISALNRQLAGALTTLPPQFDRPGLNFSIAALPFFPVISGDGGDRGFDTPPITGLIVIPGNVAFLNQFFSSLLIVANVAPDGTPLEEYWATLLELKAAGKVRALGLSNHDTDQLARAEALGHVDALQPPFSAIHRAAAGDLLPWCAEHGTGVIVYSPMQSGLLTGAFSAERVAGLPSNDWRRQDPDFTEHLDANLAIADALAEVARRHDVPVPAAAVAWTLGFGAVSGAIVGARRPEQVDGWRAAASLRLDEDDYATVAAAIEKHEAGEGPVRP